jgi:hypothetical protein
MTKFVKHVRHIQTYTDIHTYRHTDRHRDTVPVTLRNRDAVVGAVVDLLVLRDLLLFSTLVRTCCCCCCRGASERLMGHAATAVALLGERSV